ncbi:sugar ABC transporter permease [Egibacter rhizosphaerae]|uniref:Sugar ABC transporter permease n=1 Tax=Egibacter rhizosphaerae TaxID=1670831 RepID=A0A411YHQ8_9ACTN|nr:sugar ABC transporter permease [Egibacter rhizosphaerae]QBI20612.1 sugar ABC transporter permease [Egibacter rhizosphaerae]
MSEPRPQGPEVVAAPSGQRGATAQEPHVAAQPTRGAAEVESGEAGHRRGKLSERDGPAIIMFLAPAALVYVVFVVWPILNSFYFSTLEWDGISEPVFVGLQNFREIIGDSVAWLSLRNNIVVVLASLAFQLPIGLALALLLISPIRGTRVLRTVFFLPLLMSTVAIGILWSTMYNPTFGVVNRALEAVGLGALTQPWLGQPSTALPALIVVICWQFIPFYMILYRAGLTAIPEEVNEAAAVDGAKPWSRIRYVTLPLLKGTTRTAVLLAVIGSLKYFDLIYIMTGGGPGRATEVLATYMYGQAFTRGNMGYGSAIAVVLFVLAMVATLLVLHQTRQVEED